MNPIRHSRVGGQGLLAESKPQDSDTLTTENPGFNARAGGADGGLTLTATDLGK